MTSRRREDDASNVITNRRMFDYEQPVLPLPPVFDWAIIFMAMVLLWQVASHEHPWESRLERFGSYASPITIMAVSGTRLIKIPLARRVLNVISWSAFALAIAGLAAGLTDW